MLLCVMFPAILIIKFIIPLLSINPSENYLSWMLYALLSIISYATILLSLMYSFNSGMRKFINRFIKIEDVQ